MNYYEFEVEREGLAKKRKRKQGFPLETEVTRVTLACRSKEKRVIEKERNCEIIFN